MGHAGLGGMLLISLVVLTIINCVLLYHVLWNALTSTGAHMDYWGYSFMLGVLCLIASCVISFFEAGIALLLAVFISKKKKLTDRVHVIHFISICVMPTAWMAVYEYFEMSAVLEILNDRHLTGFILLPITILLNIVAFEGLTRLVQVIRRTRGEGEKPKSP